MRLGRRSRKGVCTQMHAVAIWLERISRSGAPALRPLRGDRFGDPRLPALLPAARLGQHHHFQPLPVHLQLLSLHLPPPLLLPHCPLHPLSGGPASGPQCILFTSGSKKEGTASVPLAGLLQETCRKERTDSVSLSSPPCRAQQSSTVLR